MEKKIIVETLTNVPETMLVPLYFKAKETRENGIFRDEKAVELVERIQYDFSRFDQDKRTQAGIAARSIIFDEIVHRLLQQHKDLVIVNLGAGLDTREERFKQVKWYQVDLPQSIAVRQQCFPGSGSVLVPKSVLDFSWTEAINEKKHVLFIAEGLFMYLTAEEVRSILQTIAQHFSHSFIAFNTIPKSMEYTKKHKSVDTEKAPFKWGILSIREVEAWHTGWKTLQTISPLSVKHKKWGALRWLGLIPAIRKSFVIALLQTEK
jgi:O-methyltransferase involved in polyketide biosynthesis